MGWPVPFFMSWITILLLGISSLTLAGYTFFSWRTHRTPGRPFTAADCGRVGRIPATAKRVVVLGDSLTHGTMSHNWLVDLQAELGENAALINMGTNGDVAWNALQKVGRVADCRPDIVAIFIGGNDVLATLSPTWHDHFIRNKGVCEPLTADRYRHNLEQIIIRLQSQTTAQLLLCTLTLYGEDLNSAPNRKMAAYSQIVTETGEKFGLPVLPVDQILRTNLTMRQNGGAKIRPLTADYHRYRRRIKLCLIRYHFFIQTWDRVSQANGFQLLTDGVHLNAQAADLIRQAFGRWLAENL